MANHKVSDTSETDLLLESPFASTGGYLSPEDQNNSTISTKDQLLDLADAMGLIEVDNLFGNSGALLPQLPELLERIFQFLPLNDKMACRQVCSHWVEVMDGSGLLKYRIILTRDLESVAHVQHMFPKPRVSEVTLVVRDFDVCIQGYFYENLMKKLFSTRITEVELGSEISFANLEIFLQHCETAGVRSLTLHKKCFQKLDSDDMNQIIAMINKLRCLETLSIKVRLDPYKYSHYQRMMHQEQMAYINFFKNVTLPSLKTLAIHLGWLEVTVIRELLSPVTDFILRHGSSLEALTGMDGPWPMVVNSILTPQNLPALKRFTLTSGEDRHEEHSDDIFTLLQNVQSSYPHLSELGIPASYNLKLNHILTLLKNTKLTRLSISNASSYPITIPLTMFCKKTIGTSFYWTGAHTLHKNHRLIFTMLIDRSKYTGVICKKTV